MSIYDDDVFRMACDQFQVIADYLSINKNDRERLMYPARHRRDAACAYGRWQHENIPRLPRPASLDSGSNKRRDALRSISVHGRNGGTGHVDELEMCAVQFAVWRSKRRSYRGPCEIITDGIGTGFTPLHAGDDSVCRATHRHHGS